MSGKSRTISRRTFVKSSLLSAAALASGCALESSGSKAKIGTAPLRLGGPIFEKYDGSENRKTVGRPRITEEIVNLVIQFKKENPRWNYQKITDQIVYLDLNTHPFANYSDHQTRYGGSTKLFA